MADTCSHLSQIRDVQPRTHGCEECLKTGDEWVHLRLCLTCGHVGCCDSSKNKHATRHFHETTHPIMRSFEPGETWGWCYVDRVMFELRGILEEFRHPPGRTPSRGKKDSGVNPFPL